MNTQIKKRLESVDLNLIQNKGLFISKLTNDLLVMDVKEIENLEREHNEFINKIDKNVVIECYMIKDNKLLDDKVFISLNDIVFTDRIYYSNGTSIIRLR